MIAVEGIAVKGIAVERIAVEAIAVEGHSMGGNRWRQSAHRELDGAGVIWPLGCGLV